MCAPGLHKRGAFPWARVAAPQRGARYSSRGSHATRSRTMSSKAPIGGTLAVEVALRAEAAASIKALGHRLDRQLSELRQLRELVLALSPGPTRDKKLAEYNEKRRDAEYRQ